MPSATNIHRLQTKLSLRHILPLLLVAFAVWLKGKLGRDGPDGAVDPRWASVDIPSVGSSQEQSSQAKPFAPLSVFVLMGKTGVGKSSFIESLGGKNLSGHAPIVGGGKHSVTQVPGLYVAVVKDKGILLLDTPGFDDSSRENLEILNEIVSELFTLARNGPEIQMQGVIFFHDISETRFGGSQKKTLAILKALVGEKNLGNVVVGTTKWGPKGSHSFQMEKEREQSLAHEEWKGIPKAMRVFLGNRHSAVRVIDELFTHAPFLMLAQEEMLVPPHAVERTTAAKWVIPESQLELKRIKEEKKELRRMVEESKKQPETPVRRQEFEGLSQKDLELECMIDELAGSIKSIMVEKGPRDGWFEEMIKLARELFLGDFPARKIVAWFAGGVYYAEGTIYI